MYRTVKNNTAEHPEVAGWGVPKGMEVLSSLLTVQKLATTLQIFILCPARSTPSTERSSQSAQGIGGCTRKCTVSAEVISNSHRFLQTMIVTSAFTSGMVAYKSNPRTQRLRK